MSEMTPEEAYVFYGEPENQQIIPGRGGPRKPRTVPLCEPIPVRFPLDMLEEIRVAADSEGMPISIWIRQAVGRQLAD